MANLDTTDKRRAAFNMPLYVINPVADGTIGDADRVQASGWYSGIAIAIPTITRQPGKGLLLRVY